VSERFREYATEKLLHITRFAIPMRHIDVEVSHEVNPRQHDRAYEVELTCNGEGTVIRAEAHAADKYTALDLAQARLQERLRRMHDKAKAVDHKRISAGIKPELPMPKASDLIMDGQGSADGFVADDMATDGVDQDDMASENEVGIVLESGPLVVRTKNIQSEAMTVEQAVEAMELVGHDFFLFNNVGTGKCSVLYRRRGYDFGLIELQQAS
jgi:ribosomal subunit interface protein